MTHPATDISGAATADIGLIGLAVMGENLALNMERRGFTVALYNRTTSRVDDFLQGRGAGKRFIGTHDLDDLVASLQRPRKIMMMVKAGPPVDDLIAQLVPLLEPGDILIDGGNSLFTDTIRRTATVEYEDLYYIGAGVSGGEEGALQGPSLMPGGSAAAWPHIKPIFQAICARTPEGEPCCEWMGADGAGHFVKMVHNGIEYGDMQLIGETYAVMKQVLGLDNARMQSVFSAWNAAELDSYLVQITADILGHVDEHGEATLDVILDVAGQKGTGRWTVIQALQQGVPLTLISEAVFARALSADKAGREQAAQVLSADTIAWEGDVDALIDDLRQALYASKIISYAQGYQMLRQAAQTYGWQLDYGAIAQVWREGCIIRSAFLSDIRRAFQQDPQLGNLLLADFFRDAVGIRQRGWRRALMAAMGAGVAMPCMSSALAYFDGFRSQRLPANLLQAQRDYFGAHTYERVDRPRGEFFHTDWSGQGGSTTSRSYSA